MKKKVKRPMWKEVFEKAENILEKQPPEAGKLTSGEVRSLKKPMFKDPEHLRRTIAFLEAHGDKFPIPDFSIEKVHEWQGWVREIDEIEPKLVEALQIIRHGRLLWNDQFWSLVSKVYQYLKVMEKDYPELWEGGAFLGDLMRERAKRSDKPKEITEDNEDGSES